LERDSGGEDTAGTKREGNPKKRRLDNRAESSDPRCVATVVGFKNTLSTPERRIPNRIYTEESSRSAHDS